ncbi:PilZ domain-containing protein [Flexibacterium corallicola]|uniref:PilZ domain-containing protein n=1 Tax=Flexibacterium corallicola TaxID=3037259 RepID=UPI00286F5080|nr:PilZ domain-containing protein [Pseudovibrio sp. M1P-2-3]
MPKTVETSRETERREKLRRKTLKEGRIVFGDHDRVIDCVIRDLSDTGARLQTANTQGIPDEFYLYIVQLRQRVTVKVRWRTMDSLGVEYTGSLTDLPGLLRL